MSHSTTPDTQYLCLHQLRVPSDVAQYGRFGLPGQADKGHPGHFCPRFLDNRHSILPHPVGEACHGCNEILQARDADVIPVIWSQGLLDFPTARTPWAIGRMGAVPRQASRGIELDRAAPTAALPSFLPPRLSRT